MEMDLPNPNPKYSSTTFLLPANCWRQKLRAGAAASTALPQRSTPFDDTGGRSLYTISKHIGDT